MESGRIFSSCIVHSMKIISWNINGIRAIVKKNFYDSLTALDADIICLQETKASNKDVSIVLLPFKNYRKYYNSAVKKGYSGTALLCREPPLAVTQDMNIPQHDNEGRIQCAEYDNFYIVNIYVPNSGQQLQRLEYRKQWDKDFLKYLKNLEQKKPVITCGDFNVAHRPMDLKNDKANYNKTAGYTQIEIDGMDNFLAAGFTDSFRFMHPDKVAYTYWSYRFNARKRNTGWRIDYFLISNSLMDKVEKVTIFSAIMGSDHCPIGLEIAL